MFNIKDQINLAIIESKLSLLEINGTEKEHIIERVQDVFVIDNPRALWLNFKYKPVSLKYAGDYPYILLRDILNYTEDYYLLIDDSNINFHIFRGNPAAIITLIEECVGLDEYYLVDLEIKKLICETDHGELLYIDVNVNERKI